MTSFQMYTFTSKWVIDTNTKQMFLFGKLMLLLPQMEVEVVQTPLHPIIQISFMFIIY